MATDGVLVRLTHVHGKVEPAAHGSTVRGGHLEEVVKLVLLMTTGSWWVGPVSEEWEKWLRRVNGTAMERQLPVGDVHVSMSNVVEPASDDEAVQS